MSQPQNSSYGNALEGLIPTPDPPKQVQDWHASITTDLRNHLVEKVIKAVFPSPDPAAIHDQRIRDLISYARKVENDIFETAPDKEAYYHMLAEKIYKIQKELREKKVRRVNEQQVQQVQPQQIQQVQEANFSLAMDAQMEKLSLNSNNLEKDGQEEEKQISRVDLEQIGKEIGAVEEEEFGSWEQIGMDEVE